MVGETHGLPAPIFALEDKTGKYATELQDTLDAAEMARKGKWPAEFFNLYAKQSPIKIDWDFENIPAPLDQLVTKDNPMSLPQLVTMDVPYQLTAELLHWKIDRAGGIDKVELKNPTCPGHTEFLEVACGYFARSSGRVYDYMKRAAAAKNFYAVMRPEAVLAEFTRPFNLSGTIVTTAPNGAPPHDSYPAGHGTFDGAVCKQHELDFKCTPQEIRELRATCWLHAMGRSILMVHTPQDNLQGFALGFGRYDKNVSITAAEFWAARMATEDGDVDLDALIAHKEAYLKTPDAGDFLDVLQHANVET